MIKVNDCTIELINSLGNNVKSISYNADSKLWTVSYKNELKPNKVGEDDILEFLRNA